MSIYTQCGEAARMLLDDPSLRQATTQVPVVFTELDVVLLASKEAGEYDDEEFQKAFRHASQAVGGLWRARQATRYGPVLLPGLEDADYVRIGGKIAYAGIDGPESIETPNGTFHRTLIFEDAVPDRQGRRFGTNRDDFVAWQEQAALKKFLTSIGSLPNSVDQREIARLKAEVEALRERAENAETENHRLREHGAGLTRADLEEVIASHFAARDAA